MEPTTAPSTNNTATTTATATTTNALTSSTTNINTNTTNTNTNTTTTTTTTSALLSSSSANPTTTTTATTNSNSSYNNNTSVQQQQAIILRKNLLEWDRLLRTSHGEDWSTMLGRLNAALNQTNNLDRSIEDVMEHFVYVPKQSTANPGDIPFFLSTRLELQEDCLPTTTNTDTNTNTNMQQLLYAKRMDPVIHLTHYERQAAQLAMEYEEQMVRFG